MIWSHRQQKLANRKRQRGNSALQIKSLLTYQIVHLRSTTGDSRLNHLMMLYVHKDRTDALTLVDVANDFVGEKENQKQLFAKFQRKTSQTTSLFRQSQHKRKTKCIVDKCSQLSDMYQKVCFNQGTEAVEGGSCGSLAQPPSHFMLATGLSNRYRISISPSQVIKGTSKSVIATQISCIEIKSVRRLYLTK